MPVRVKHTSEQSLYYITFTCFNWLPLFQLTNSYDVIYKWFAYLKEEKYKSNSLCYYAQPSSLHFVFTKQYPFLKHHNNQTEILEQLASSVSIKEKEKGQKHKAFEESFDAKSIDNKKFFLQKLNYIHLNPVRGSYRLANDWREYEHSSAGFYELQVTKHFTPVHYMELQ